MLPEGAGQPLRPRGGPGHGLRLPPLLSAHRRPAVVRRGHEGHDRPAGRELDVYQRRQEKGIRGGHHQGVRRGGHARGPGSQDQATGGAGPVAGHARPAGRHPPRRQDPQDRRPRHAGHVALRRRGPHARQARYARHPLDPSCRRAAAGRDHDSAQDHSRGHRRGRHPAARRLVELPAAGSRADRLRALERLRRVGPRRPRPASRPRAPPTT